MDPLAHPHMHDRREFLYGLGASLGSVALTAIVRGEDGQAANAANAAHHRAKAKRCIFLMMEGGPSHIDTFDPKPELAKRHLQAFTRSGEQESAMSSGKRYFVQSPFDFIKAGESGADICTEWRHLAGKVDDICFYRGAQAESVNHPTACYHINTGNRPIRHSDSATSGATRRFRSGMGIGEAACATYPPAAPSMRTMARSVFGSVKISTASNSRPS